MQERYRELQPPSQMRLVPFKQLFDEHSAFVWRILRRHGVPLRELEDACQEVFLVVFRRLPEFEGRSSLRTWIYGIAVRVALGLRRRAFMRRELLSENSPDSYAPTDVFDAYAQHEVQRLLHAALLELPRAKREVFVLYELEGMTIAESADALGVPENTALYRLYGARKALAASLRKRELRAASGQPAASRFPARWFQAKKGAVS
jgi:RNA polymerase sigma-70 factor (ECF subfamily)